VNVPGSAIFFFGFWVSCGRNTVMGEHSEYLFRNFRLSGKRAGAAFHDDELHGIIADSQFVRLGDQYDLCGVQPRMAGGFAECGNDCDPCGASFKE
jgi:hypothetical protein